MQLEMDTSTISTHSLWEKKLPEEISKPWGRNSMWRVLLDTTILLTHTMANLHNPFT
jgi:hypothetical protein